jgi:hypothetical protein
MVRLWPDLRQLPDCRIENLGLILIRLVSDGVGSWLDGPRGAGHQTRDGYAPQSLMHFRSSSVFSVSSVVV